jgi:hypothetical protein
MKLVARNLFISRILLLFLAWHVSQGRACRFAVVETGLPVYKLTVGWRVPSLNVDKVSFLS